MEPLPCTSCALPPWAAMLGGRAGQAGVLVALRLGLRHSLPSASPSESPPHFAHCTAPAASAHSILTPPAGCAGNVRFARRDLTSESLALITPAWPGVAALFPALLSLDVWGGLIGMFELNNLAMAVPSPVEDYFLLVRTWRQLKWVGGAVRQGLGQSMPGRLVCSCRHRLPEHSRGQRPKPAIRLARPCEGFWEAFQGVQGMSITALHVSAVLATGGQLHMLFVLG